MAYVNGSDLLVMVGAKAVGHCTTHTATFNTETKETAVKPLASVSSASTALFKEKRVSGLSVQVKADGIVFASETEGGFKDLLGSWKAGASVALKLFKRGSDSTPYCSGNFVISTLENTAPAGEDATYSATFDNDGEVAVDETKFEGDSVSQG